MVGSWTLIIFYDDAKHLLAVCSKFQLPTMHGKVDAFIRRKLSAGGITRNLVQLLWSLAIIGDSRVCPAVVSLSVFAKWVDCAVRGRYSMMVDEMVISFFC